MPGLYKPTYTDRNAAGKTSKRRTAKWYGWYKDESGKKHRVPLSEDKAVAAQMLAKLVRDAERGKAGLTDPVVDAGRGPPTEHLADYEQDMRDRQVSAPQCKLVAARIRRLTELCGFKRLGDITPAKITAALAALAAEGLSVQTRNFHLQSIKQFCRWLERERRLDHNPVQHLKAGNVKLDRRHDRRALTATEITGLIEAAERGGTVAGLSGPDRAILYTVAVLTGLRASELASLTSGSFDLAAGTVVVEAAYSKHRCRDVLPLDPSLIPILESWLAGKPAGVPVWPGTWSKCKMGSRLLRHDGQRADIAYKTAAGYADFHSLRHTFISNLVAAGVVPKLASTLARHSTITLTMDRYAHVELDQQAAAVAPLEPRLNPACITGVAAGVAAPAPLGVAGGPEDAQIPVVTGVCGGSSGEDGIRTRGRVLPRHRFSKPALSATQPPLQSVSTIGG